MDLVGLAFIVGCLGPGNQAPDWVQLEKPHADVRALKKTFNTLYGYEVEHRVFSKNKKTICLFLTPKGSGIISMQVYGYVSENEGQFFFCLHLASFHSSISFTETESGIEFRTPKQRVILRIPWDGLTISRD